MRRRTVAAWGDGRAAGARLQTQRFTTGARHGRSVAERYEAMVRSREILSDPLQRQLAAALDALTRAIEDHPRANGGLGRLLSRRSRTPQPRGLYIWGGVGRGKTLLMDLFFESSPIARKRRVHFHQFMAEVHDRIAQFRRQRKQAGVTGDDPIAPVARDIASEIELLCFDEFAVYDIADAMILGRLFERFLMHGVIVVATTNVAPDDLYKGGLNRALFLPFIALLKARMTIFYLDAPRDYRLDALGGERRYVTPLGVEADRCLDAHFHHLSGSERGAPTEIVNKSRRIAVPDSAAGVARFGFQDICSRPLGAGDFSKLAERFHTIVLADVPILSAEMRNEAKRLINLVDTIYDMHVRLIVSAAAEPNALWQGVDGVEAFEFRRTASRLIEMTSDAYWEAALRKARHKKGARAF